MEMDPSSPGWSGSPQMGDRFLGDSSIWTLGTFSPFMDGETKAQRKGVTWQVRVSPSFPAQCCPPVPQWLLWGPHPVHPLPVPELWSPGAEGFSRCFSFLVGLSAATPQSGTVIHHGRLWGLSAPWMPAPREKWEVLVIGEVQAWDGPPAPFKCLPSSLELSMGSEENGWGQRPPHSRCRPPHPGPPASLGLQDPLLIPEGQEEL